MLISEMRGDELRAALALALEEYYTEQAKMLLLVEGQAKAQLAIEEARLLLTELGTAITAQNQALRLVGERTGPLYKRLSELRADELRQAAPHES
ncbi:MAG: hypothetical protein WCI67_09030 [Chloroflexales bacterium]